MLSWLPKLMGLWAATRRLEGAVTGRLSGATSSSTTKAQWKGSGIMLLALAALVAGAGQLWPDSPFASVGAQEAILAALLWALSPLASRLAGRVEKSLDGPGAADAPSSPQPSAPGPSVPERSSLWVEHVKTYQQGSWTDWRGTAMDAVYEGWDLGATATGEIWDLHEFRHTGAMAKDPDQRARAMEKVRAGLKAIKDGER